MMSALEWVSYRSADRLVGLSPGIVEGIARRGVARELDRHRLLRVPDVRHHQLAVPRRAMSAVPLPR